jgi:hypothetical protein
MMTIVQRFRFDRLAKSEQVGQRRIGRVAQQRRAGPTEHRRFLDLQAEPLEQTVGGRVLFGVRPGEKYAVLGQKISNTNRVIVEPRADDAQPGKVLEVFKDSLAGDKARQDEVAEGAVFAQQALEVVCVHFVNLRDPEGHGARAGRVAGKVGHVAGEFTGLLVNGQRP